MRLSSEDLKLSLTFYVDLRANENHASDATNKRYLEKKNFKVPQ